MGETERPAGREDQPKSPENRNKELRGSLLLSAQTRFSDAQKADGGVMGRAIEKYIITDTHSMPFPSRRIKIVPTSPNHPSYGPKPAIKELLVFYPIDLPEVLMMTADNGSEVQKYVVSHAKLDAFGGDEEVFFDLQHFRTGERQDPAFDAVFQEWAQTLDHGLAAAAEHETLTELLAIIDDHNNFMLTTQHIPHAA